MREFKVAVDGKTSDSKYDRYDMTIHSSSQDLAQNVLGQDQAKLLHGIKLQSGLWIFRGQGQVRKLKGIHTRLASVSANVLVIGINSGCTLNGSNRYDLSIKLYLAF